MFLGRFYEWKKDGPKKQPYYIHFKNDKYLVFAALYDSWKSSEGEELCFTSIGGTFWYGYNFCT